MRRWIARALRRHKRGALHRQLGVPAGETIPVGLLREAAAHPERFKKTARAARLLAQRARLALRLRGFSGRQI